jgi:hypothetical protein
MPARIIDPEVEASVCASGNQICRGTIGILTAKAKKNAIQQNFSMFVFN